MPNFEVISEYTPSGDQPEAIAALAAGIENGLDEIGRASCRERVSINV